VNEVIHKRWMRTIYIILVLIPLVMGTGGLIIAGQTLDVALFNAVLMFTWGYDEAPVNIYVSIARWIAPFVTISGIAYGFKTVRHSIWNMYCYYFGSQIAIYGDSQLLEEVKEEYGSTTITCNNVDKFVMAKKYILLMDDDENVLFCKQFHKKIGDAMIYMCGDRYKQLMLEDENLRVFCPEENAARVFWKSQMMYVNEQRARQDGKPLKVALIGFGELGENLIYWGLQHNLFHPDQRIEYHIYTKDSHFLDIYHELGDVEDKVIFHDALWYEKREEICDASMVILCEQKNQDDILQEFLYAIPAVNIYVFLAKETIFTQLTNNDRVCIFDWTRIAYSKENVLTDSLYKTAKQINIQYAEKHGEDITPDMIDKEWNKLSTFTKCSNLSAADFLENIHDLLEFWGYTNVAVEDLPEEVFNRLGELEHMRWCRFHYLNNWKYGELSDGKTKDNEKRIHTCLVPYDKLSDAEKKKDTDNVKVLLESVNL